MIKTPAKAAKLSKSQSFLTSRQRVKYCGSIGGAEPRRPTPRRQLSFNPALMNQKLPVGAGVAALLLVLLFQCFQAAACAGQPESLVLRLAEPENLPGDSEGALPYEASRALLIGVSGYGK